jgi:hypothetical protein
VGEAPRHCGQYIDYHEFDQEQCDIAVDDLQGDDEVEEVEVDKPVAFTAVMWVEWHEGLINYLQQKKGHASVPLLCDSGGAKPHT